MHKLISSSDKTEMRNRIARIQQLMPGLGIDALLVSNNANICYTSGRFFRGYTYIPSDGDAVYFAIRPNNLEGDELRYIRKPEQIPEILTEMGFAQAARIGLELDTLPYSEACRLMKVFPGTQAVNASPLLKHVRMVKTPTEIALMETDGKRQAEAYRKIPKVFREGMTDVEFQIEIERLLRLEGSIGYYRTAGNLMEIGMGSVLTGANADTPTPYDFAVGGGGVDVTFPVGANGTEILNGTTVMIDMNGAFNGYQTDMTRVWALGRLPEKAMAMHECSRRILRELERMGKPGTPVADLYLRAIEIVKEEGFEEFFMGHTQKAAFIGHGVGIELNEMPVVMARSKDTLETNMTIALEPKFVIPEVGAVGVENTYVVTADGLRSLTVLPEEIGTL